MSKTNFLWLLLRTDFAGQFGVNRLLHETDKKKKVKTYAVVFSAVLGVAILMFYSFLMSYGYGSLGIGYVIPGYAMTITSVIIMFFTFLKTNGMLFGSKDYDLLVSFPIPMKTIVTSKFLSMYLNNVVFTALVMIPMGIGYLLWNPVNGLTVSLWMLTMLLAPLFPMTIAATVAVLIAFIGSGFRHKVLAQVILTAGLIGGIFVGSFWAQGEAGKDEAAFMSLLSDLGILISQLLHQIYPLSAWIDEAINEGALSSFLLFAGLSFGVYAVYVWICGKYYKKINTALRSHHMAANYEVGQLKRNSMMMALAKKEARRFFSSTVYVTNMGMGLILALLFSVATAVFGVDKIIGGIDIPNAESLMPVMQNLVPFAIAMMTGMCCTTAVSLSLEGQHLWVMQSLPIPKKTLFHGKMLFNILLDLPVSFLCSVIFMVVFRVNVWLGLAYIIFSVVSVLFTTVWGMWANLHFPNYTWTAEVQIIKQSISSMMGILGNMVFFLALGALAWVLLEYLSGVMTLLFISGIMVLITCVIYGMLLRGMKHAL